MSPTRLDTTSTVESTRCWMAPVRKLVTLVMVVVSRLSRLDGSMGVPVPWWLRIFRRESPCSCFV